MTNEEYKDTLDKIHLLHAMTRDLPLQEFIKQAQAATVIGPFLDPTLYRAKQQALYEDVCLAQQFYAVQKLGKKNP